MKSVIIAVSLIANGPFTGAPLFNPTGSRLVTDVETGEVIDVVREDIKALLGEGGAGEGGAGEGGAGEGGA